MGGQGRPETVAPTGAKPEVLRDLVVYLSRRTNLNGTRVQKLLYLVEAEYADRHGVRLMDHEFYHDRFGMNSKVLEDRVLAMSEKRGGPLVLTFQKTDAGVGFRVGVRGDIPEPKLPHDVKEACDFVVTKYGSMSLTSLVHAAKQTLPFYGTAKGEKLDWSALLNRCPSDHEDQLSARGREILERAMRLHEVA